MTPLTFCAPSPLRNSSCLFKRQSPLICPYRNQSRFSPTSTSIKLNPFTEVATKCVQEATRPAVATTNKNAYDVHEWNFRGFTLEYAVSGVSPEIDNSAVLILVHGFGANCRHWRHNLAPLASNNFRVFALDLIGFGMGDKPIPGEKDAQGKTVEYTFDYWTEQLYTFITQVVRPKAPVFLMANSIGAMVTMQLSAQHPSLSAANVFISPSLRQLNVRKRSWLQDITAPLLMQLLAYRPLGSFFLKSLARPKQLSSVLMEAYEVYEAVDNELIDIIAKPAGTAGALEVFFGIHQL
ncbi:Pimeloyl-[acyl-carrier protein] methyl ester esterase [Gracilariopsis chorda]|uniref:Pimeloyl-[acyl-carrier protein] methyl ester esterase n=1 Tax=Gracilariopsis chorda TaxID=448386 RepID=A0A2V3J5X4_9FLOR|nr:Pimeloyl-[acyl-carrier protein] methyl ester esterase [Gracilariopsis chorda]|eukprot:PXF49826.1 Pimeloyl-[acyl-carrier protein] methyl ester esterase [Gracilariopsis chorda]